MKHFILAIALILFTSFAVAGTLTINTTSEQDARIVAAFGKHLNTQDCTGDPEVCTPRDATGAEVKASLIQYLKGVVHAQERKAAREAADATIADLTPE